MRYLEPNRVILTISVEPHSMSVYFFFSGRTRPYSSPYVFKTAAEDFPSCRTSLRQKIEGLSLKGLPRIPSLSVREWGRLGHGSASGYLIRHPFTHECESREIIGGVSYRANIHGSFPVARK
jgi:hypothetical protein